MKRRNKFLIGATALALATACVAFSGCTEKNPSSNSSSGPNMDDYNLVDYYDDYGDFSYGYSFKATELKTFKPSRGAQIYEADMAELSGDAAVYGKDNDRVGYLTANSRVTYHIRADYACDVLLILNIATADDDWDGAPAQEWMSITVNGTEVDTGDCWIYGTGDSEAYGINNMGETSLEEGENTIVIKALKNEKFYLDWMVLTPKLADIQYETIEYKGGTQRFEAEDANGRMDSCKISDLEGFSNGKVLDWTEATTKVEFKITADQAYKVCMKMQANFGGTIETLENRIYVDVNGDSLDLSGITVDLHEDTEWWTYSDDVYTLGEISLVEGENIILITANNLGVFNIDYFELSVVAE